MRKVPKLAFSPTRFQHNGGPILSLRSPNELPLCVFIIFSLLCSHYVTDLIKKLETRLMVVSIFLKTKLRHAQISVPKIGISMSKTAFINPRLYKILFSETNLLVWSWTIFSITLEMIGSKDIGLQLEGFFFFFCR